MSGNEQLMAFSSPVPTYSEEQIAEALDEAVAEVEREPRTDLRASFWDRLIEGGDA